MPGSHPGHDLGTGPVSWVRPHRVGPHGGAAGAQHRDGVAVVPVVQHPGQQV